ncbi:MAG: ATP-binding protein [Nocardioidaceae bacterium]
MVVGRHRLPSDVASEVTDDLARTDVRIVVCDLSEMAAFPCTVGQLFAPVASYLAAWPGTLVVVCVPDPGQHAATVPAAIATRLLLHDSVDAGVREARSLTQPLEQTETHLPPVPQAAGEAREFANRTLRDWHLQQLSWPASLVTSELVTNSLQHSVTVLDLTLGHVRSRVRIAVHDHGGGAPAIPNLPEADRMASMRGRGLQLVDSFASAWGVFPSRDSGKTVWALLEAA